MNVLENQQNTQSSSQGPKKQSEETAKASDAISNTGVPTTRKKSIVKQTGYSVVPRRSRKKFATNNQLTMFITLFVIFLVIYYLTRLASSNANTGPTGSSSSNSCMPLSLGQKISQLAKNLDVVTIRGNQFPSVENTTHIQLKQITIVGMNYFAVTKADKLYKNEWETSRNGIKVVYHITNASLLFAMYINIFINLEIYAYIKENITQLNVTFSQPIFAFYLFPENNKLRAIQCDFIGSSHRTLVADKPVASDYLKNSSHRPTLGTWKRYVQHLSLDAWNALFSQNVTSDIMDCFE